MKKKRFQKNQSYFWLHADFEVNNEIDFSNIGNKTIIICKRNPVWNGYYIVSEMADNFKTDYYESPLG